MLTPRNLGNKSHHPIAQAPVLADAWNFGGADRYHKCTCAQSRIRLDQTMRTSSQLYRRRLRLRISGQGRRLCHTASPNRRDADRFSEQASPPDPQPKLTRALVARPSMMKDSRLRCRHRLLDPIQALEHAGSGLGASALDRPLPAPNVVQTQPLCHLRNGHRVRQVLLVSEHQEHCVPQVIIAQHPAALPAWRLHCLAFEFTNRPRAKRRYPV